MQAAIAKEKMGWLIMIIIRGFEAAPSSIAASREEAKASGIFLHAATPCFLLIVHSFLDVFSVLCSEFPPSF
jgi:hypothetical protein